ncbi:hypothetical protein EMIT0324P_90018 [Pseudomonas chlororaphis]
MKHLGGSRSHMRLDEYFLLAFIICGPTSAFIRHKPTSMPGSTGNYRRPVARLAYHE